MQQYLKLNQENLFRLPAGIMTPGYDRRQVKAGIIHIGVGAFHRSHQAYYTDLILRDKKNSNWGICGIALLESDMRNYTALAAQDGLYTLTVAKPDGSSETIVPGSLIEYMFAPENPDAVIEKIANPDIKIITLTITEGGYNFNTAGEFLLNETSVQWDISHPAQPKTVFGYLAMGLKRRMERSLKGLTIQSCDNIQKNGDLLKRMLLSFIKVSDPGLVAWVEKEVTFPNSMVDRITPAATETDTEYIRNAFGIEDRCPVVCEPFVQWVIEDNYAQGRPDWESAGVQFADDVAPFEKMKIRLLNAGHSLLGFLGVLHGYTYIHEVVNDPVFARLLRDFMDNEVTPVLDEVPGTDLSRYKDSLLERFGNPRIRDKVARICQQSSAKIPKFLLPTIHDQLRRGAPVERSALVIAAWCRYAEGFDENGSKYQIEDEMSDILQEKAIASHLNPLAFLEIEKVFGDIIRSERFTKAYLRSLNCLYHKGAAACAGESVDISF
ncbi:MAG: mannitol dehydrogenase family protein [Bacteroidales bacterium]|nr:mannitol dehydrogenase family protein [Bacteroidales bacterium]